MARTYWVSPRSWVVTEGGVAARAGGIHGIRGVAAGVVQGVSATCHAGAGQRRMMLEVFTSGGYAIIDREAQIVTTGGIVSAREVLDAVSSGGEVFVELYLGEVAVQERAMLAAVPAPHCVYFPEQVVLNVLDRVSAAGPGRVVIGRAAFAYAYWMICKMMLERGGAVSACVDNYTFPSEIRVDDCVEGNVDGSARVLAITTFAENDPQRLEVNGMGIYPCCDGILLA